MSKIKTLLDEVKEQAVAIKDSIESEKIKRLDLKIEKLTKKQDELLKENHQLKALLIRVIEDLDKENKRNRSLLKSLQSI